MKYVPKQLIMEAISFYVWVFHVGFHDLKSFQFFLCFCAHYASVYLFLSEDFALLGLLKNACFLILGILTIFCQCCIGVKNLDLFVIY
jgi:hypothetical protein